MTILNSYKNGSSSSSAGSSKNHNCYHVKCPQCKALRAIGSSSYNFLAKFQKSWYREIKEFKDYTECEYKHARYCYFCYQLAGNP